MFMTHLEGRDLGFIIVVPTLGGRVMPTSAPANPLVSPNMGPGQVLEAIRKFTARHRFT